MKFTTFSILILFLVMSVHAQTNFTLIGNNASRLLTYDSSEGAVVRTALDIFKSDYLKVTGKSIELKQNFYSQDSRIVIGTLGKSDVINSLIRQYKLNTKEIEGQWEAFSIHVLGDNKPVLVVIGSNDRGTAYGILELSRMIGVSPWSWWADVPLKTKKVLTFKPGLLTSQKPSVAYRGIFINDEDWGLNLWNTNTFDPSEKKGNLGPKAYSRVMELLLRLRANTLWPAMHECTIPFFLVKGNKEVAEKYGISIGSSHAEPMNRNNVGEWKAPANQYNYLNNKDSVKNYWLQRLKEVSNSNTIFTLGMRGIHDSKMQGAVSLQEQTDLLSEVIKDQRILISENIKKKIEDVPQVFIPYKEVLDIYNNGIKIPDDITLLWCDDNYGYINRLSSANEQQRAGGAGVYYHISYWGRPHDYLWLATSSPEMVYQQMKLAWETNARKMWILNVGDIKPSEYLTELFLDMAWDIDKVKSEGTSKHLNNFFAREFSGFEESIASILQKYYQLAYIRKPEFMGWSRVEEGINNKAITPVVDSEYNPFVFGDELQNRINEYHLLESKVENLSVSIPISSKSAFFQLVEYPVVASSLLNKKLLYAQKARLFASHNFKVAEDYKRLSNDCYQKIILLTKKYNSLGNGKWKDIMNMNPRSLPVFQPAQMNEVYEGIKQQNTALWLENDTIPLNNKSKSKIEFIEGSFDQTFIEVFYPNMDIERTSILKKPEWLDISTRDMITKLESKIMLSVNWQKVAESKSGEVILKTGDTYHHFDMTLLRPIAIKSMMIEGNNSVVFNNEHSKISDGKMVSNLGYKGNVIALEKEGTAAYDFYTIKDHEQFTLTLAMVPNHPVDGKEMRYMVIIDGKEMQMVNFKTIGRSEKWKQNVLSNQARDILKFDKLSKGKHNLIIKAIDSSVMIDQIFIDFQSGRKFYEIP